MIGNARRGVKEEEMPPIGRVRINGSENVVVGSRKSGIFQVYVGHAVAWSVLSSAATRVAPVSRPIDVLYMLTVH